MFCYKCGKELASGARFCDGCGTKVLNGSVEIPQTQSNATKLVLAQCTNCSATLEVDASQSAAICPYCGSAYIVDQAISNYNINVNGNMNVNSATINVNGLNSDNLLQRAKKFEQEGDLVNALDYYNKVLDVDITIQEAQEGVERVKRLIDTYVYMKCKANSGFTYGVLELMRDRLVFRSNKGKENAYLFSSIKQSRVSMGCLCFSYEGKISEVSFGCTSANKWVEAINNAKVGLLPKMVAKPEGDLADIIRNKYNRSTQVQAIKYCREQTGWDLKVAKEYVENILL